MEIERKYLVKTLPEDLDSYPCRFLEQGYLSTEPVVRVRQDNDKYELTYKSKGLMVREEYNLPLTKGSYDHLKAKADGRIITKKRYMIPFEKYTIELDVFEGDLAPLTLAEVEFTSEEEANAFVAPDWFAEDVTFSKLYHNSFLSRM
jgi:CYTH domain-containing protein